VQGRLYYRLLPLLDLDSRDGASMITILLVAFAGQSLAHNLTRKMGSHSFNCISVVRMVCKLFIACVRL
jgi:hypothetical protein